MLYYNIHTLTPEAKPRYPMRYIISLLLASSALGPAWADAPKVVTDIPPVQALVAQVMGDLGTPVLLLEKGANEHDFQLRPSQAQDIADAGLIVWVGPELTPWLDRALSALAPQTATLGLLDAPGTTQPQQTGAAGDDGHAHDHHDHADEAHDHGGTDPHAWLNPDNARAWLAVIAAELARLDPGNAATYGANARAAEAGITALDADLRLKLTPIRDKAFVTQHDAYGHFTAHFNLTPAGSVAMSDAAAPGAARLRALADRLAGADVQCLFPEAQHDPAQIQQLATASGARVGGALDPAGSLQDPGPGAYAATLNALAESLMDCLAG